METNWLNKIVETFGKNYMYLMLDYVPITEEGFLNLQEEVKKRVAFSYDIHITHHSFKVDIPEEVLQGIAIATYVAGLPIRVVECKGDEIDLPFIALDNIYMRIDEITKEVIEDMYDEFTGLTCALKTTHNEVVILTGRTAFTLYGIKTAFDWSIRKLKGKAPRIEDYIIGLYISDDNGFSPIEWQEVLGFKE